MNESEIVRSALELPEVHEHWLNDFYTDESRAFYEIAFDHIERTVAAQTKTMVLDAGCGAGSHSIRLALRGYPVLAVDVSEYTLARARANVTALNLNRMVTFKRGSLSSLPVDDNSFDFVLCWNALMVVPEVDKAILELCRAVRPNGFLIISEDNMWSIEAILVRIVRRILGFAGLRKARGKDFARPRISAAGAEYWHHTDAGPLLCRVARISWLLAIVAGHGFELKERIAGEFLEGHVVPGKVLKRCVQAFNRFWFKRVRLPHPAMGNLLIFQKKNVGMSCAE